MARRNADGRKPVTRGTGNVFADLGFPDAAERQARLRLAYALNQELEAPKISQADAASREITICSRVDVIKHRRWRSRVFGGHARGRISKGPSDRSVYGSVSSRHLSHRPELYRLIRFSAFSKRASTRSKSSIVGAPRSRTVRRRPTSL
jgi:hypothetical protein